MVDVEFKLPKEGLIKKLDEGYDYAIKADAMCAGMWLVSDCELEIQADMLFVDLGEYGWVGLSPEEFTSEMIVMMLETKPELATPEVLNAFIATRAVKRNKEKGS